MKHKDDKGGIMLITYRVYFSGNFTPYEERTVKGKFGQPSSLGFVPILVKGKIVDRPHWTAIKDYIKPGYF